MAGDLHKLSFVPEAKSPLKTLDLPLGGSASPVDALALLIDFFTVANSPGAIDADAAAFSDDEEGEKTIETLKASLRIANRITGNSAQSLGLHPIVYFTNEKGKSSRFLFLGMCALISKKLRNNDSGWFRKFTLARSDVEKFLIENKSAIGIVLQNLGKKTRMPKMSDMLEFLVDEHLAGRQPDTPAVFKHLASAAESMT